ncbi:MAG: HAD family hydrolase [Prevotella sp.]|nr:HAD family hydrolase [Bacteroides sp.]MCM1365997.1 HAD family hydrolase [Prevotella sp.]MCM1436933.1 HAD family hydrolase [Prevotella sp.]
MMDNPILENIHAIIFDYGGTLDTAGEHWSEVIWLAYHAESVAVSKGQFRQAYVYAERELARVLHILPNHKFDDMLRIKIHIQLQWLSEQGLFPPALIEQKADVLAEFCYAYARRCVTSAAKVLKKLHEKYPLALVSNFYGNLHTVLKDFNIDTLFDVIVESATAGVRKPDPKIFRMAVTRLRIPAEDILVIGDSVKKDILPAKEIGCKTAWLESTQWETTPIELPQGTYRLPSLASLISPA